ncbi:MAG: SpoIID/LytB domain-containing protein [Oscillibacter sp.]|jgi:stage II sporulation protein D|nr:SpoIID/LytB domain-containing protein [Oscillibacter sp.]
MKKFLLTTLFVVTFITLCAVSACAVTGGMVKVGLKYGTGALFSANLENAVGSGYTFGYYNSERSFVPFGSTGETTISMSAAGIIYIGSSGAYYATEPISSHTTIGAWHVQLGTAYSSFDEATSAAARYTGGYPAYISGTFYARFGSFASEVEAVAALSASGASGTAVSSGSTGVTVTVTKTATILFEFDCQGSQSLAVQPQGAGAVTWFKGYKYYGGFEYDRITGGNINIVNVVDLEDYIKGVIPYEMSADWPTEALKAQAVCARTYASGQTKHLAAYGFDVCNTTDCQVYYGVGNATAASDAAVEATAGQLLYADGSPIGVNAVYFSCDGGATEDAENVWGSPVSYLLGKPDPYEALISIPNYAYTVNYTADQLTWVLQNSGYSIGTIQNVVVSERTNMGNVYKVTFTDTSGKTLTVKGEKCRTVFYSSTYGKSVRSMRFDINGGTTATGSGYCVNSSSNSLATLSGAYTISGSGTVGALSASSPYVITSSGTSALSGGSTSGNGTVSSSDGFTITGTGNGHNVGMSQYGAYAMAQNGDSYQNILNFYYTNVAIG